MIAATARRALEEARAAVTFDAPLSRHVSLRVGGPAGAIASPRHRDELSEILEICPPSAAVTTDRDSGGRRPLWARAWASVKPS